MDLWDIGRLLLRRWYVFVPLLLLTGGATVMTSQYVKPEFTATGSLLLLPPTGKALPPPAGKPFPPSNAWAEQGPVAMAQAITIAQESQTSREAAKKAGVEGTYTLSIVTRSAIVTVTVTSKSPKTAAATIQYVLKSLSAEVAAKQKAFAEQPTLKITTENLDGEGTVTAVTTGVRRAQIAIGLLGLLLAIVASIAVDSTVAFLRRRRARAAIVGRGSVPAPIPSGISGKDNKVTAAETMVLRTITVPDDPAV